MEEEHRTIEIDGICYSVCFRGFAKPMKVRSQSGKEVCLLPWKFRDLMFALEQYLKPVDKKISLDRAGFAQEVLKSSNIDEDLFNELTPLALWWAAGGGGKRNPKIFADSWVQFGSVKIHLKTWSHKERVRAISKSFYTKDNGSCFFNIMRYLEAMVKTSVVGINPSDFTLDELDAASTAALLDAVVTINVPAGNLEKEFTEIANFKPPQIAQTILRLCSTLGWTPTKVLDTPASEVNRLLALLDMSENNTRYSERQVCQGLATHPDAIIIQVDED